MHSQHLGRAVSGSTSPQHEREEASPSCWEELHRHVKVAADHNFDGFVIVDADTDTDTTEVLDDEEIVQLVSGAQQKSEDANDPDTVEAPVPTPSQKAADNDEPGFMYYFMSVISDVAANRFINSSAIYYAPNMSFTPSYKGFFNKTMPLFAPRAYRADDFNDPYHLEGTSTLNTIDAVDLGAIPADTPSRNYSSDQYRINEWYHHWLPDLTKRQDSKTTYTIQITHFNGTNETFVWHGPPGEFTCKH
ncbi:hypothetical protein HPB52_004903 [Rhipicephalus sanguineus]|uniref:Uncharacterized protein n=1 Tax=Rhipicephalus sanguineus TaxID=34632 RepID=A0A9D4STR0_RHISA|nr:hypothetical protein HPB52_004903 [Rhipicephalus sanguineus]